MGKRFIKFRVSRVIPSFQSCRNKDPSSLPANPVPLFPRHSPSHSISRKFTHPPSPPPQPISKPHGYSLKRHVSSALLSARRTLLGVRPSSPDPSLTNEFPHNFQWDKDRKWHVIAQIPNYNVITTPPRRKIYTSASSDNNNNNDNPNDVVVFPPLQLKSNRKRRTTTANRAGIRRRSFQKIRLSTSSDSGLFSEDDDDDHQGRENHETDTLVSTDESTPRRRSNVGKTKPKKKKKRRPTTTMKYSPALENNPAPARLSVFMRRMVPCRAVEGKVRESFAVVKKSEDPYEDFKRSMAEMVVEKQMFEASELEELLRCFLSLNSVHHHEVIVRAFTEIWEALFSQSS